jgi:ATP-dependent RNA helicase RhlE
LASRPARWSAGCDVLVATPGRLLDLIDQRALTLRNVEIFVLDEADQMMDLGFIVPLEARRRDAAQGTPEPVLLGDHAQGDRRPGKQFINNPVRVEVAPQATTPSASSSIATFINQAEKQALLTLRCAKGLADGEIDRALVFTRTKHGADRVVRHLAAAGVNAAAIHGNKSQAQRTAALQRVPQGHDPVLVATDIAARGIDVSGVSHVFNFEMPNVPEQYVHRIGRTARAGADGIAISFVAPDEKPYLRDIERLTDVKLMPMLPLPERLRDSRKASAPRGPVFNPLASEEREARAFGHMPSREARPEARRDGQAPRRDDRPAPRRDDRPRQDGGAPRRDGQGPRRDGQAPRRDGQGAPRSDGGQPRRDGGAPRKPGGGKPNGGGQRRWG